MRGSVIAIAVTSLLVPGGVRGQESVASSVRSSIAERQLMEHARVITSHVRPSGSVGENAAIDYIARVLGEAGVPVTVHEFTAYTSDPVAATVTVLGTNFAPDAITASFSASTDELIAPVVDLGPLSDLPHLEVGTGERLVLPVGFVSTLPDVRGAIAVVDGQPRNTPVAVLTELGAAGILFVNEADRLNELIVTSTWGTPSLRNFHRLPTIPVAQIKRSDGATLRALMADSSVMLRLTTRVDQRWRTLRLPVARIEPSGQTDTPYVLLGGHIDGWHHGATDEGAANAAMLSMAIAFHAQRDRLRRGLVVAWWPGHSNARYGGSTWFADRFFEELRDRAVAYLNIDGVGQRDAKRFSVTGTASLQQVGLDIVRARTGQDVPSSIPGRNSDQSFNGIGMPLLQFNHTRTAEDGGYWWWHTPEDTFDKIDAGVLKVDTDLYVDAIGHLTTRERLPIDISAEFIFLTDQLRARQTAAGDRFDLSLPIERSMRLVQLARQLGSKTVADVDILRVLRPVHRVLFTPLDAYHPDPGQSLGPLPGLAAVEILRNPRADEHRQNYAMTMLVRERNRILDALAESERLLQHMVANGT